MSSELLFHDAQWMADSEADKCLRCALPFSIIRRRHHCRWCGRIYCEKCAPQRALPGGTPCLRVHLTEARRCNTCCLPYVLSAHRYDANGALHARPAELVLSFLDDKSIGRLQQSCRAMMHQFPVRDVPYFEKLQDRLPTLFEGAIVGKGACGTVYRVEDWKRDGMQVAVKVIVKASVHSYHSWKKLFAEIEIMRGNDHVNVARLFEVLQTRTHLVIIMELGEGGSLKRAYEVVRKRNYDIEVFTATVVGQVAAGLDYLYRVRKIVHRDIKHDNIVLSKDFSRVMIIDFGLAEYVRNDRDQRYVPCGTMGFASPENIQAVVERKTWFPATGYAMHVSDIFSLGVVAFMLLSGQKPLKGTRFNEQHQEVRRGIKCDGARWTHVSSDAKHLIEWLLLGPTAQRARPEDVINHRFVISSIARFDIIENDRTIELERTDRAEEDEWVFVANQMRISEEWRLVDADTDVAAVHQAISNGHCEEAGRRDLPTPPPATVGNGCGRDSSR